MFGCNYDKKKPQKKVLPKIRFGISSSTSLVKKNTHSPQSHYPGYGDYDYSGKVCHETYKKLFHRKLNSISYNTCLAITATSKKTLKEKFYQKQGLVSLDQSRW